jgi:hypothetical protein
VGPDTSAEENRLRAPVRFLPFRVAELRNDLLRAPRVAFSKQRLFLWASVPKPTYPRQTGDATEFFDGLYVGCAAILEILSAMLIARCHS